MNEYEKTGYLKHDFKVFHLTDYEPREFKYHYHSFHKILLFVSGDVTYHVEGKAYPLQPDDIVLVQAGEVHRPQIHSTAAYERRILYVSPEFLNSYQDASVNLNHCFLGTATNKSNVLRIPAFKNSRLYEICRELENTLSSEQLFNPLYQRLLFLEFMILLNRMTLQKGAHYIEMDSANEKILSVLSYINANLTADISIDSLSERFYVSKYYLMHSFKRETGYTIGNYLATKRLLLARAFIEGGMSITEACYSSGYRNYSTFSRAYKKLFHQSAGQGA